MSVSRGRNQEENKSNYLSFQFVKIFLCTTQGNYFSTSSCQGFCNSISDTCNDNGNFLYITISSPYKCSKCVTLYPMTYLFIPKPCRLLWEAFNHIAITAPRQFGHIIISTTVYAYIRMYIYIYICMHKQLNCVLNNKDQDYTYA